METATNSACKEGAMGMKVVVPAIVLIVSLLAGALYLGWDQRQIMEVLLVFSMAQGWNLLCGYTGLLSFGHHAFVGLGAYALFMTTNVLGWSPYASLGTSGIVALFAALVMALLLHRLREAYFSIGIWVLADSLRLLFGQWDWVGSSRGLVLNPSAIDPQSFTQAVFWLAVGLAVVTQVGTFLVLRTKLGLALMAMRDDEAGAASIGIATTKSRLAAFAISAVVCGLAGGLYYLSVLYVDPSGAFDIDWQIRILFIVIVGGLGTLEGPIVGTLIYFVLREAFHDVGTWYLIFQGATAMVVMLLAPGGIWGSLQARIGWRVFSIRWTSG
jgi:branched-chain amino acid transport system permease protein